MKISFGEAVDDGRGHWVVKRVITHDDGSTEEGVHVFPYDTLEWRAAEYGIDPSDLDTLMDIVLSEPYLTEEDWSGPKLYDGGSTLEEVRAAHISRCAQAKLRHRMTTRGKSQGHLKLAKDGAYMNAEALELKREMVSQKRERNRMSNTENSEDSRISHLRKELYGKETNPRRNSNA